VLNDARRKSTGAKLYSRPSTLKSTEVNVSIAPMELAPMLSSVTFSFLARDVIYTSRTYATMSVSVCPSVNLSVTEVHWHIIANLGFKFRSQFTNFNNPNLPRNTVAVHAGTREGIITGKSGGIIWRYDSHC